MLAGHLLFRYDLGIAHHRFQLLDAGLQFGLLFLGGIVFSVLGKVSEGPCNLKMLGNFRAPYRYQIIVLLYDLVVTFLSEKNFFCHDVLLFYL